MEAQKASSDAQQRIAALAVSLFAAFYYLWMMDGPGVPGPITHMGDYAYNYLFLSILEGRLDLPVRTIGHEGHYDSSGRAFMYHGFAPLIFRLLAYPFVDLETTPLGSVTVGSMAVLGSAVYTCIAIKRIERMKGISSVLGLSAAVVISILVWFVGGGLIVSSNSSLYQEPIAVAYAMMAVFLLVLLEGRLSGQPRFGPILILALAASITLHARPHVAIGMYLAIVLLFAFHVCKTVGEGRRREEKSDRSGIVSCLLVYSLPFLILFASGALLLLINHLRFGSIFQSQGASAGSSIYGVVYWGVEALQNFDMSQFEEGGIFNVRRIPVTFLDYIFDPLFGSLKASVGQYLGAGYIVEEVYVIGLPSFGIAFMWLPWVLLILLPPYGRVFKGNLGTAMLLPLLAAGVAFFLLLSYPAISIRYRVDIWPLVFLLALVKIPHALSFVAARRGFVSYMSALVFSGVVLGSLALNLVVMGHYSLNWFPDSRTWSLEKCLSKAADRGFSEALTVRTCAF